MSPIMVNAGLLVCALGALMLAIGAARFLRTPSNATASAQRWWQLVGAGLIGAGFLVQLIGRV
jgi:hypothetical protein